MESTIGSIKFNKVKEYLISKDYIDYLVELEALNYLKRMNIIDINLYDKAIVYFKKSHIGK